MRSLAPVMLVPLAACAGYNSGAGGSPGLRHFVVVFESASPELPSSALPVVQAAALAAGVSHGSLAVVSNQAGVQCGPETEALRLARVRAIVARLVQDGVTEARITTPGRDGSGVACASSTLQAFEVATP